MGDPAVVIEDHGGVLVATLDRAEHRNSLTPEIEAGLEEAIRRAATPAIRALLLQANGPVFCAGANARELDGNDARSEAELRVRAREIPERLLVPLVRLEKPVVAAIEGPVVGAGIGLVLAADFRVVASSASFMFAFHRVGLAPDLGTCWSLPRLVGLASARDILLRGRIVDAAEARTLQLADDVCEPSEVRLRARALAEELASGPTLALGFTKRLLERGQSLDLETFLEHEVLAQSALVRSDDHHEGIAAFRERRPPDFGGR